MDVGNKNPDNAALKKQLRVIKGIILGLLIAMVAIDLVLVFSEEQGFPTFSKVFLDHRTELIWVNFLYGGVMTKIFWYRTVDKPRWEFSGFLIFAGIVVALFITGMLLTLEVSTPYQILILIGGGAAAYAIWPQYVPTTSQSN
ncbi:MAG: hypothetical protein AAGA85_16085 [Bacteroidota bacterium]